MVRRKRHTGPSHSVSPVRLMADAEGNPTGGWSQTLYHVRSEQSIHWAERQNGNFTREEVYPCNEGFPGLTRIGPVEGGWPRLFDLVLSNGARVEGTVSAELVDDLHSWAVVDAERKTHLVSYYDVAGWATPTVEYEGFERVIAWLIEHWPSRR